MQVAAAEQAFPFSVSRLLQTLDQYKEGTFVLTGCLLLFHFYFFINFCLFVTFDFLLLLLCMLTALCGLRHNYQ